MHLRGLWLGLIVAIVLVGCWKTPSGPGLPALQGMQRARGSSILSGKITHVIFIVQENRTFDNIFGGPKPFPEATTADSGMAGDKPIALNKIRLAYYAPGEDPNNYHGDWMWACNPPQTPPPTSPPGSESPCRMNGFMIAATPSAGYTPPASTKTIYSYLDYNDTKPYWEIARKYALGDHFFMGHNSESYTAHQYIFSAQSNNVVDPPAYNKEPSYCDWVHDYCAFTPWGCDSPSTTTTFFLDPNTGEESKKATGPFPCFGPGGPNPGVKYPSLADRVDEAGLTWRLYGHSLCQSINGLDVNASIRYSFLWPSEPNMSKCHDHEGLWSTKVDTKNFRMPEYAFLDDITDSKRELANVTWILPGVLTSDHPGVPFGWCGPSWVANIVNAVGRSKYWDSTVIFVFWDDWGGFYDHVKPYVVRDAAGPGFRVPLLVISPYAKRNAVAHTETEFGTLLKFSEELLGLKSLGADDASPYLHNLDDFFQTKPEPFASINPHEPISCKVLTKRPPRSHSRWARMIDAD
ncbi:MAG: alkaline phosphatase family protein [Candidatus Baltobacteraceae bacterium]